MLFKAKTTIITLQVLFSSYRNGAERILNEGMAGVTYSKTVILRSKLNLTAVSHHHCPASERSLKERMSNLVNQINVQKLTVQFYLTLIPLHA